MIKVRWLVLIGSYLFLLQSIWEFSQGNVLKAFYSLLFIATLALINLAYKPKE